MIKQITMSGIKGQTGIQPLTGKDIIIGHNGAGKTTRMQAMSLAAFGYVPGKGKTAESTFELASEDTMTVGINTEDFGVLREYKKSSKLNADGTLDVKISQGISISPSQGERTIKEKEQRIREEIGNFPTMLDFNSFIEMSDIKQRDFIYNLSGGSFTWDRERVSDRLRDAVLRDELGQNNPEMYDCMEKNYEEVMQQYNPKADVQSGLLAMTERAKEQLSYWKKEKTNADAAARKLTELKNRGLETDRNLADNYDKLKAMEDELEKTIQKLADLQAQNRIITAKEQELERLNTEISSMEGDNTDVLDDAIAKIELYTTYVTDAESELKKAQSEIDVNRENVDDLTRRMQDKQAYIKNKEAEKAVLQANIKSNSELIEAIQQNIGFCAFSKDIPCGHDFSEFINARQDIIDAAYDTIDQLDTDIQLEKEVYRDMEDELDSYHTDIRLAQSTVNSNQSKKDQAEAKLEEYKGIRQELENSAPILTAKRSQADDIILWLNENPKNDWTYEEEIINGLKAKITALKETITEQEKVRNDIKNIKANIIDSQTAAYEVECWNQICEAIGQKGIQGDMVKEMLDPLRATIDEKLEAMNLPFRFYFRTESDRGKEVFEFGGLIHGAKRPFGALSQGEQLLLLVAMMSTIIERSNPPVKILAIDNVNHLDRRNLLRIISGLDEAGKNMDNIVLAGTPDLKAEDAPGWTIWNLSEEQSW